MLIVEGSDGTGKTRLCHQLVKELNDRGQPHIYTHLSRPPRCWEFPGNYAPWVIRTCVQDRFHMSELVYSRVREKDPSLTSNRYALLDAWLREVGAFTVVLTGEDTVIEAGFQGREQMYDMETVLRVNKIFISLCENRGSQLENEWYRVDVDCHIHTCAGQAWPSARTELVWGIVDQYLARQADLEGVR